MQSWRRMYESGAPQRIHDRRGDGRGGPCRLSPSGRGDGTAAAGWKDPPHSGGTVFGRDRAGPEGCRRRSRCNGRCGSGSFLPEGGGIGTPSGGSSGERRSFDRDDPRRCGSRTGDPSRSCRSAGEDGGESRAPQAVDVQSSSRGGFRLLAPLCFGAGRRENC